MGEMNEWLIINAKERNTAHRRKLPPSPSSSISQSQSFPFFLPLLGPWSLLCYKPSCAMVLLLSCCVLLFGKCVPITRCPILSWSSSFFYRHSRRYASIYILLWWLLYRVSFFFLLLHRNNVHSFLCPDVDGEASIFCSLLLLMTTLRTTWMISSTCTGCLHFFRVPWISVNLFWNTLFKCSWLTVRVQCFPCCARWGGITPRYTVKWIK